MDVLAVREHNEPYTYAEIQHYLQVCYKALQELRAMVLKLGFRNVADECYFFKEIKPMVFGNLIFYSKLLELEIQRPKHSQKERNKFVTATIVSLEQVFSDYREFHQYMLSQRADRDKEYFCRKTRPVEISHHTLAYCCDPQFSTNRDSIAAIFYAHTKLIDYFSVTFKNNKSAKIAMGTQLNWTGQKVDLVELIYAFQASGLINNGRVEIKELATVMEKLFNIELGDCYRTFLEIRMRKSNQSKLLDTLKKSLINKIAQADS